MYQGEILNRKYKPAPTRRVEISKQSGESVN